MRLTLYTFLALLFFTTASAQNHTISGTIIEKDNGMPIPGANIIVKNTNNGVVSDFDGLFTINEVPNGATLQFSYVGFVTYEVVINKSTTLNIQLETDVASLDEVVVIGYGSQKLSKVSGSVSKVDSESIETLKPVRVEEALQSSATGINVVSNGSPGKSPAISIRGVVSAQGSSPLVVVDGVIQGIDDLNTLNPSDVESINVLKDAALTAIYGVKGGNGVIVVTTKSGKKNQKVTVNFDSSYGVQEVIRQVDVLNASEYAAILNEASVASGGDIIFPDLSTIGKGTNWQDEVIETAAIQSHNISVSGGSEKISYFFSGGFLGQDGVVGGNDKSYFDRTSLSGRINADLSDKFKLIVNTNYANIKDKSLSENNIGSVLSNALNFDPMVNPYNSDGSFGISETITQEIINPLTQLDNTYNEGNTNKITGKLELQYKILDNVKLTSRFGYNYVDVYTKNFTPLVYYGVGHNGTTANPDLSPIITTDAETGEETSTHNRVSESNTNYFSYTYELFGNYDFNLINENHNFETVLGLSLSRNSGENITANAQDIPFNSWSYADVSAATGDNASQTSGSWQYLNKNMSYFGRLNYDFNNKYLVSILGRYDGSSTFGDNNRYGLFYAASLGWVASNEDFFNSEIIDFLKIRGSYGATGSDNLGDNADAQFSSINTFPQYTFDGNIVSGSTLGSIPNPDLSWETQKQLNAGFDIRMFTNKISMSADYYQKDVVDLIFRPSPSLYLGDIAAPSGNVGASKTNGVDISLGYNNEFSDDFSFSTNINFTTVNTEVTKVDNGGADFVLGAGYGIPYTIISRFEEGETPWYFYGYQTDGIFQTQEEIDTHATQTGAQPGDIRFADINGDGVINDEDRTNIGNPFPDFTFGWNASINYKNIDFNIGTYASIGNDIYRAYERNSTYTNRFASTLDRWTGPGTSDSEPRVTFEDTNNNTRASDRYIEDGSFFKIKNLQLGYTIPNVPGISKLRLYAQVKNVYTFTKYSGYDPEISSGSVSDTGVDRGTYPIPRIWSVGLNVNF
ncbi:TonB-dependent receptor [Oceanihabitans sp. 2_MG-2023]|uniref:SusC/RagA family TonB-linked outer membrane protein n=1 Tax=Oceanihabitans sp. 2_MG-2023 TaxID=3062661 RepID=UPI0026E21C44|nr:TonB-dependent receptor [Oceanihabitans sp. 2_MG-2023]MDO6596542.1 TonB-dependent receptor [Oceanihabitans sp. 2_MG-2023]